MEPPTFTICFEPAQKYLIAKKYNFKEPKDVFFQDVPNTTFDERLEMLSYTLNNDFVVKLAMGTNISELKVGHNFLDEKVIRVEPIVTWDHGICTSIIPQFEVTETPTKFQLIIKLGSNPEKENRTDKILIYLTSNETWRNIAARIWPQFKVSKIEFKIRS